MRLATGAAALLGTLAVTQPSAAQTNAPDWVARQPGAEVVLSAVSVGAMATALFPQREGSWGPSMQRERHETYGIISDFSGAGIGTMLQLTGSFALEAAHLEDHDVPEPFGRASRSSLIDLQSAMLATGATYSLKRWVGRCRPRAWRGGRCAGEEYDAFPSGHVTPVAAIAGSRLAMAVRTDGVATKRYLAFGFSEGAAALTAVLRLLAGAHSWEDVAVAYVIGHGVGAAVGLAHPMQRVNASAAAGPPPTAPPLQLSWAGSF